MPSTFQPMNLHASAIPGPRAMDRRLFTHDRARPRPRPGRTDCADGRRAGALLVNARRQTSTATRQRAGYWNGTNVSGKWADKGRMGRCALRTLAARCRHPTQPSVALPTPGSAKRYDEPPTPWHFVPSLPLCVRGTDPWPWVGIGNLLAQEEPTYGTMSCLFSYYLQPTTYFGELVFKSSRCSFGPCFNLMSKVWLKIMTTF